jgi:hypothetical protein
MHDATFVRRFESVGDLERDPKGFVDRQAFRVRTVRLQALGSRLPA